MSSTALTGERQTQTAELLPGGQTAVQSPVLAPIDQLPVADDGEFSSTKLVRANDRRLGDARTPLAHRHTAEDITQTEDRRFVSAEERGAWNAHLSETDPHGDRAWAADPSHLAQDSTHRFISDAERVAWNAKAVELPIGVPGGAAPLNEFGQVPASYLPPRSASDYATAYLGRTETAADAAELGGKTPDAYAEKVHAHDDLYLGKTAKATSAGDADKLGGKPASDYATQADLAGLTPGGGTGGSAEGAWTLVRNPNDYLQSLAVGATGRCIQCETGNIGQVGGLPWAWVGVVPAMAGAPVSPAYLYILRASSGQAAHHAYARVHVTGALEIIEHGASVDDYRVWRIANFVSTWLAEARAMQIACAPGVHPVVQVLNGATWTTVAGVEEGVGTAPAWGRATLSTGQHVQAYDWPAGRCPLGAILIGAALAADELAAWAASGRWPYWVEAGGSAVSVPVGTLTLGRRYYIAEYTAGDDFANCGAASSAAGGSFIATAASPTVWAGSRVVTAGAVSIPQVQSGVAALPDATNNVIVWSVIGAVARVCPQSGLGVAAAGSIQIEQAGSVVSPRGGEMFYAPSHCTILLDELVAGSATGIVQVLFMEGIIVRRGGDVRYMRAGLGFCVITVRADGRVAVGFMPISEFGFSAMMNAAADGLIVDIDCMQLSVADGVSVSGLPAAFGDSWPVVGAAVASTIGGRRAVYFPGSGSAGGVVAANRSFTVAVVATWDGVNGYARTLNGAATNWLIGPYSGRWCYHTDAGWIEMPGSSAQGLMVVVLSMSASGGTLCFNAGGNIRAISVPAEEGPGTVFIGTGGKYSDPARSHVHQVAVWSLSVGAADAARIAALLYNRWSTN